LKGYLPKIDGYEKGQKTIKSDKIPKYNVYAKKCHGETQINGVSAVAKKSCRHKLLRRFKGVDFGLMLFLIGFEYFLPLPDR